MGMWFTDIKPVDNRLHGHLQIQLLYQVFQLVDIFNFMVFNIFWIYSFCMSFNTGISKERLKLLTVPTCIDIALDLKYIDI